MSQGFAREARLGVNLHVGETLYFTSSGSFVKADYPGLYGVRVKVQGGGGGGAGTGTANRGGGGGGGGAYAEAIVLAADLGTSETITVGAGGAGGAAGNNDGSNGAASSFGSHAVAGGGAFGWAPANYRGGAGGTATAGDLQVGGGGGGAGSGANPIGGIGGSAHLGGAAQVFWGRFNGGPGKPYGGGGGGASESTTTGTQGGAGADGIVIVEVLYERKIAVDEDIHPQYFNTTRLEALQSNARWERGTSGQTTTSSATVDIIYNTEIFKNDPNGDFTMNLSTGTLTINNAGLYLVMTGVHWASDNTGGRFLGIQKNASGAESADRRPANETSEQSTFALLSLAATDTINGRARQTSGGNLNINANSRTFLSILRIH